MNDKYKPVRKVGAYNRDKTKKWNGKKWVPVNVVHRGQKATLGGKPVVADGNGNWRSPGTRGNSLEGNKPGSKVGSYQSGDRNRTPSTTSKPKPSTKPQVGRNWSNPHGQVSNKPSEGDRSTWAKPKPKPKPDPKPDPAPKPKPSPSPTPTRTKATPTPATSANGQNLRQGRSPDKPARKPRTWLADNYKPGGPPKNNEAKKSLQIKPKKKKLTNKQRKQGGFH